jgi:transposase-like protein
MNRLIPCQIVSVGKRRDGGTRYWCLEHKADATAKYGRRAHRCRYAHIRPISPDEVLNMNVATYPGGVGLWGAVPPVYDTTRQPVDCGIHVHARSIADGEKDIDATYRSVGLATKRTKSGQNGWIVSELDAVYYMVTSVFGYPMKYVECTLCGFPHLDKDWFSVHAHRRHLCAGCGKQFRDTDRAIGNPVMRIRDLFSVGEHKMKLSRRTKSIRQIDYPGGIQIWGSNEAILWTASREEERGIHIHAFTEADSKPEIDDTFSRVAIDGVSLDAGRVRILMAQNALPHIAGRVTDICCPRCAEPHFDTGEHAFTPHERHICTRCCNEFRAKGRFRHTIGNPMVGLLDRLGQSAVQPRQQHKSDLLTETV